MKARVQIKSERLLEQWSSKRPRALFVKMWTPPLVIWRPILERDTNKIGINIVFLSCKKAAERERLLQNIAIF